jgi:hypothetical protein
MTEEAMTELVISAGKCDEPKKMNEAVSALAEFLYTRFHQFRLDCRNEDVRSDYLVWIYPRLPRIISRYKSERASLRTYLNWVVKLSFRTFIRNRFSAEARQKAFESEEATRILSMEQEEIDEIPASCLAERLQEYNTTDLSAKKSEIRARKILLLACKAGNYLDDAQITKVCRLTGCSEQFLREKLECIQKAGEKNRLKARKCLEKQNGFYIRARKCLVEMEYVDKNSARFNDLEKEYSYCRRRWESIRSGRASRIKPPSNRFLAGTLGISRGTIDSTLASAMQDGYDLSS